MKTLISSAPADNARWNIKKGDVLNQLHGFDDNTFDGLMTDPPYGLRFMEHKWDAGVPTVDVWKETLRVCKPGAFLLAFGGTRTFHRLASNIEDAGWEIRDCLMWLYGQGFPKSHNISKAVKKKNAKQAVQWHSYGTALKPGWEPIIVAVKPRDGSFARNAVEWGCGGLNIDACRIGTTGGTKRSHQAPYAKTASGKDDRWRWAQSGHITVPLPNGRWPANVILDEEAAAVLDQQSGVSKSCRSRRRNVGTNVGNGRTLHRFKSRLDVIEGYEDEGGASRFFFCPKVSKAERQGCDHPTLKPITLCEYLAKLILPPARKTARRLLVPYSGSGSEMIGALKAGWDKLVGIEIDAKYVAQAKRRLTRHRAVA
jgi:site-specific DNA-methyltransferase (adenine-specific)